MNKQKRLAVLETAIAPTVERITEIHRPIIAVGGKEVARHVHVIGNRRLCDSDNETGKSGAAR